MKESDPHKRRRLAYRNKLAKEANKRMRELEKSGLDYAAGNRKYRVFIKETYGKKTRKKRFREYGGYDNYVTKEINRLEKFLGYQTSTPEGVRLQTKHRMETTEKRYGLKFDNVEDYEEFIDFLLNNEYAKIMDSDQVIEIYQSGEYTQEQINEMFELHQGRKKPKNMDDVARTMGFNTAGEMKTYFKRKKSKR